MVEDRERKQAAERTKKHKKRQDAILRAKLKLSTRTKFVENVKQNVIERFKTDNRRHNPLTWYRFVKSVDFHTRGDFKFLNPVLKTFVECVYDGRVPKGRNRMIDLIIKLLENMNQDCKPLPEVVSLANASVADEMDVVSPDDDMEESDAEATSLTTIHVGNKLQEAGSRLLQKAFRMLKLPEQFRSIVTYDTYCSLCCHLSKRMGSGWIKEKADTSEWDHPSFNVPLVNIPIIAGHMFETMTVKIPISKLWYDDDLQRCILSGPGCFEDFDPETMMNMGVIYLLYCPINGFLRVGMTVDALQRINGSSGHNRMVAADPLRCTSYLFAPHADHSKLFQLTTSRWKDLQFKIPLKYDAVHQKVMMNEELLKLWDFSLPMRRSEQSAVKRTRRVKSAEEKARIVLYSFEIGYGCCQSPKTNLNVSPGFEKYRN